MSEERSLSIIVVPDDGKDSHTFRLSYRRLRILLGAALAVCGLLAVGVGSWWYFAAQAVRASELEARLEVMEVDQARLVALSRRLREVEGRYEHIRSLFGTDTTGVPSDLWLPPTAGGRSRPAGSGGDAEAGLPTSWPLTEAGFVTQNLLAGSEGEHPGLDIAVPTGSYIRASGGGEVVDVGEEEVYGRYVVIEHDNGYRTRYAHASRTFVEAGQRVRRDEVIALSGSTGQSTAPHLHFEILLDGEAIDPLTMVDRP